MRKSGKQPDFSAFAPTQKKLSGIKTFIYLRKAFNDLYSFAIVL